MLGLRCCVGLSLVVASGGYSLVVASGGYSLVVVHGLLIVGNSLAEEPGL